MSQLPENIKFKPIPNHDGYVAGEDGSIWTSLQRGKEAKFYKSDKWKRLKGDVSKRNGRLRHKLRQNDGSYIKRKQTSHIILEAWVGPKPDNMECCHNDGNCLNNSVNNLRWDTHVNNENDKLLHGTRARGSKNARTPLTEDDVYEIKLLHKYEYREIDIIRIFNVGRGAIASILQGRTWRHILINESNSKNTRWFRATA